VTSIERTAYPRFKRFLSARELHVFYTPQTEEIAWASGQVRSDNHLLALMVQLKCFNRMGYFPRLDDVPEAVVAHIRRDLGLGEDVAAVYDSDRTRGHHRMLIRRRSEVVSDMPAARAVAAAAIREAAGRKNDPADLINVALEKLVEGSFELPGYTTLDEMAATIREEVNSAIFALVVERIGPAGVAGLDRMLVTAGGPGAKSDYNRLKRTAPRPSWTNYRLQIDHLRWVDSLGDARAWWEGIAPSKIADFAGEGEAGDPAVVGDYGAAKRIAILAAMVYAAQQRARDDIAEMFCRRVATLMKRARVELEELKKKQQKVTEALIVNYRQVLEHLDPLGPVAAQQAAALEMARKTVEAAGGFPEELARIDVVRATHGDNHVPLVARHFRKDRSSMLAMVGVLDLEATGADRSVLRLLDYMREHTMLTRDHIPDRIPVFASENWNKAIRDRNRPGMFVRRHLEACVLTYLAEELRTGDVAVTGAQAYANWADQLLTPDEAAEMLPGFCAEVGIPATAAGFRADLHERLDAQCRAALPRTSWPPPRRGTSRSAS
jgi:hypothetical protein